MRSELYRQDRGDHFGGKLLYEVQRFFRSIHPYFKIIPVLIFWMLLLYAIVFSSWFISHVANKVAIILAEFITLLLRILGNEIEIAGTVIRSNGFAMEIYHRCTGIYQLVGLTAGIFSWRTCWKNKAIGIGLGAVCICMANVIRIVHIFYTGIYKPQWVPVLHGIIWEGMMILLIVILWIVWAKKIAA